MALKALQLWPSPPVATQLRAVLAELNVTQIELSQQLGVTNDTVSRWSRGITKPLGPDARRLDAWLSARGFSLSTALAPDGGARMSRPPLHIVGPDDVADPPAPAQPASRKARTKKKETTPMAAILPREAADEDLLEYWALPADPFQGPTTPADIWLPQPLVRLENRLIEAMKRRQIVAVVGEPGSGKSTLLRRLWFRSLRVAAIRLIRPAGIKREDITHSSLMVASIRDLINEDVSSQSTEKVAARFREVLADQLAQGLSPCLVIDEAHRLSNRALIAVKEIWDSGDLLQPLAVLLVGQSSLEDRLRRDPAIRELTGRTLIRRVEPMTAESAADYLRWCFKGIGRDADQVFSADAYHALATRGQHPLWLNNVALGAMRRAQDVGADKVTAGHVAKAGGGAS